MGLQFAPQLLLLPWTGSAADRLNQRKLLRMTQATMGVLALCLGVLTLAGPRPALARLSLRLPVRLCRGAGRPRQADLCGRDGGR